MRPFTSVFVNIQAGLSLRAVRHDVRAALAPRPDILAFAEIGGVVRASTMRAVLRRRGYSLVRRSGPAGSVPIAYRRRRFRRVKSFAWFLSPKTPVGESGAGPSTLRAKEAMVLLLEDKRDRGEYVAAVSAHLAPSIYIPVRKELHEDQVRNLALLSRHLKRKYPNAVRLFMGDYNTPKREHLRPLTRTGIRWGRPLPTHGKRPIDYNGSDAKPAGRRTVDGLNTDHRALWGRHRP